MNEDQKRRLQKSFSFIKKNITNVEEVADELFSKSIFDWNAKRHIHGSDLGEIFDNIFDLLLRSTKDSTYQDFLDSLNITGNHFIAKKITEETRKTQCRSASYTRNASILQTTAPSRTQAVYPRDCSDLSGTGGATCRSEHPNSSVQEFTLHNHNYLLKVIKQSQLESDSKRKEELERLKADIQQLHDEKQNQFQEFLSEQLKPYQLQSRNTENQWIQKEGILKAKVDKLNKELEEMKQKLKTESKAKLDLQKTYETLKKNHENRVLALKNAVKEKEQMKRKTEAGKHILMKQQPSGTEEGTETFEREKETLQNRIIEMEQNLLKKSTEIQAKEEEIKVLESRLKVLLEQRNQSLESSHHSISSKLDNILGELMQTGKKPLIERDESNRKGTKPTGMKKKVSGQNQNQCPASTRVPFPSYKS